MKKLLLAGAVLMFLSCGGSTGGKLINIPFDVGGVVRDTTQPFVFSTPLGWTVELDNAVIALGPFYFNVAPPQTQAYHSGVFIMEVTSQVLVDALDPTLVSVDGGADGESGTAVAAEIELFPPDGTGDLNDTELLGSSQAFIKGTATRSTDGLALPFQGFLTIDQTLVTPPQPLPYLQRVNGAVCDLVFTGPPQVLTLRVDPTHWFDEVDFSSLIPPTPLDAGPTDGGVPDAGPSDGGVADAGAPADAGPTFAHPLTWTNQTSFHQELMSGMQSRTGVYQFSLETP